MLHYFIQLIVNCDWAMAKFPLHTYGKTHIFEYTYTDSFKNRGGNALYSQYYSGSNFYGYGGAYHAGYAGWPNYGAMYSDDNTAYITGGNVCAYAPDKPVYYNKINVKHWPSMDYQIPHPKGFLHTLHQEQHLGEYIPYK